MQKKQKIRSKKQNILRAREKIHTLTHIQRTSEEALTIGEKKKKERKVQPK